MSISGHWTILDKPDEKATWDNGAVFTPRATLVADYESRAQIAEDDHCYVLLQLNEEGTYTPKRWWWREAVEAVQRLPLPT